MNRILQGDILSFAKHYKGEPFHALICDAPYHLTSITDRFGKEDAAPAQEGNDGAFNRLSTGFMGKSWDGGDIAFRPETWRAFWNLLYPGAFGMTFGGSRTSHRMAVAIEDAGYIIHPMIGWIYGSGFPKATRIDTQIDKAAGAEQIDLGESPNNRPAKRKGAMKFDRELGEGKPPADIRLTVPATDLAKTWEGHRYGMQALKPALEPIIVFQKPYEGRPVDDITRTGAGALNIEGGRIGEPVPPTGSGPSHIYGWANTEKEKDWSGSSGRWPANFIIQHSPDCKQIGTSPDGYTINRFTDGAKPFGDAVDENFESEEVGGDSIVWECADGCPARELDRQSSGIHGAGVSRNSGNWDNTIPRDNKAWGNIGISGHTSARIGDSGGASRFFFNADYAYEKLENAAPFMYQAKAGRKERNAGLSNNEYEVGHNRFDKCATCGGTILQNPDRPSACSCDNPVREHNKVKGNPHPTIKPIALIKHLATLLLPPDAYSPRRIFVPFAGTGSEIIGAYQAGWECVIGVEKEAEYVEIAKARIAYWEKQGIQLPMFDIID